MTGLYESIYCRLHDFVTGELEGTTTSQQRREFAQLLRENEVARQIYIAYTQELASLRWSFAVHPADLFSVLEQECPAEHFSWNSDTSGNATRTADPAFKLPASLWQSGVLAVAASLLIALGWIVLQRQRPMESGPAATLSIGQIVHLANIQWSKDAEEFSEWSHLSRGDVVRFDTGLIDIMLSNGAEIELKGPAEFQLVSLTKARLRSGKLVARCGPDAVGFEVESPDASVVDLGTSFGVSVVDSVRTDVAVYDGAVDISTRTGAIVQPRRLTAGEALHVTREGEIGRIAVVSDEHLLIPRDLFHRGEGHSELIGSVRDDLQTAETVKYYRIIGQGFGEDCRAFVDRDHQWNGVNASGLPPFLVGGDYVLPFNDDKIYRMELEVELTKPASVFVLLDDRIESPPWLLDEFVDTGWDAGLDESYDDRENVKSGVGAGVSIDHVFSVWRKDFLEPTTAKLGYIQQEDLTADPRKVLLCMYGIVVTDLQERLAPAGL